MSICQPLFSERYYYNVFQWIYMKLDMKESSTLNKKNKNKSRANQQTFCSAAPYHISDRLESNWILVCVRILLVLIYFDAVHRENFLTPKSQTFCSLFFQNKFQMV